MIDLTAPENQKYRVQFAKNCARVGQSEEEYIQMMRIEEGLDTPAEGAADAVPNDQLPADPRPARRSHGRAAAKRRED